MTVRLIIDGVEHITDPAGPESLLSTLRDRLGLTATKNACEQGECGSCTVVLDGLAVCSCLVMTADADGAEITTAAGVTGADGALHAVQEAMIEAGAVQCGFCTPGIVVAAAHLFETDPHPDEMTIKEALSGNLCRCTGYGAIVRALLAVAEGDSP